MTELCITVSKSKASLATLQGWGAPSHRTPPSREIICTDVRHQKRGRDKHQPQTAEVGCQLPGTSVEGVSISKSEGHVWVLAEFSHHTRKSSGEVWKGQTCCARSWILGLSRSPTRSPVKQFELTQLGSAKQLARGTIQATGAWIETFQRTNENQGLQQMVLKKVD